MSVRSAGLRESDSGCFDDLPEMSWGCASWGRELLAAWVEKEEERDAYKAAYSEETERLAIPHHTLVHPQIFDSTKRGT